MEAGEEPVTSKFKCHECCKFFKNKNGLNIHFGKTHRKEKSTNSETLFNLPSTSSGFHGIPSILGRYFRPKYTFSQDSEASFSSTISQNTSLVSKNLPNKRDSQCTLCKKFFCGDNGLRRHFNAMHNKIPFDFCNKESENNFEISATSITNFLSLLRQNTRILERIPKSARQLFSIEFNTLLSNCIEENSVLSWFRILLFPYATLRVPDKSNNEQSLTSLVKQNLSKWQDIKNQSIAFLFENYKPKKLQKSNTLKKNTNNDLHLSKKVDHKLSVGDIHGAVRLLCSEDTLASDDDITFQNLKEKHPLPLLEENNFVNPPPKNPVLVSDNETKLAIFSFKPGSAGGLDSLKPQHLKDMINEGLGTSSSTLLFTLSKFIRKILEQELPEEIRPIFFGASLCALKKKDGGLRPIAVGCTLRRLVAKIVCSKIVDSLGDYLRPIQLGFGTKCGIESAVHATRRFISFDHKNPKYLLKIDFSNAFNMISRSSLLSEVSNIIPDYFHFIKQSYLEPSLLSFNDRIILSQRGVQQGDPLGPALFSLTLHPIINSLKSDLNLWYLDDGTLCGDKDTVLNDFNFIIKNCERVGLEINFKKCEVSMISPVNNISQDVSTFDEFISFGSNIKVVPIQEIFLLGCPLADKSLNIELNNKIETLKRFCFKLEKLSAHSAFFLLKHSFSIPRLTYLLRCTPCWKEPILLNSYDMLLKNISENITNSIFDDKSWSICKLPVRFGGLGIRDISSLCFSAFIASNKNVSYLLDLILPQSFKFAPDIPLIEAKKSWSNLCENNYNPDDYSKQKLLDEKLCNFFIENILSNTVDKLEKARLLALQEKESGAWLNSLPSASLGTHLDNSTFRISIALRTGQPVCVAHTCRCGEPVLPNGLHGLSCRKSAGRWSRHSCLNDIIKRALVSASIPAVLEPPGIFRTDGKRADGLTLIPWKRGRPLVWDATCSHTLAASYLNISSRKAGEAAKLWEISKTHKYSEILQNHFFVPFCVETFGPWGEKAKSFFKELGEKIKSACHEPRASSFLMQRISLAIQRGNAASVLGTLPELQQLDEVFYL